MIQIYFSDFFGVSRSVLEKYGAFNVSLINDLPLFVDPFLLFNSEKKEYRNLHNQIIQYLQFLRDKSLTGQIKEGLLRSWFTFPEVKQNWLGYSKVGNIGSGLSTGFAQSLHGNLHTIFSSFGNESITMNSHLEKLCLIESGVGRDKISDFTTNLIKDFLLVYTEQFAQKYIDESLRHSVVVNKVRFNYRTESWENREFDLPVFRNDFVILTPKDILTKDETWINRDGLHHEYYQIARSIPNEQLRAEVNNYFLSMLPKDPSGKDEKEAIERVIRKFPQLIEYYIRYKEDRGDEAVSVSNARVEEAEIVFVQQVSQFVHTLASETDFYVVSGDTHEEAMKRVLFLKDIIENKGGHRIFYAEGKPIRRESDLHILFRLTWFATFSDVSREVNDGRGPADFKISRGSLDKTIFEFKLASNPQLRCNLRKQVELYKSASDANHGIKVIAYFSARELAKLNGILNEIGLQGDPNVILIDANKDNKPSASKA